TSAAASNNVTTFVANPVIFFISFLLLYAHNAASVIDTTVIAFDESIITRKRYKKDTYGYLQRYFFNFL
ncbi:MAG: hypothetical protein IKX80_02935, partial [Lachnospiraceae bacterium]|nr:hypothetical protein [Lachnospiraceae bacterium]